MSDAFKPGALAVVTVTEWPRNMNRVVEIVKPVREALGDGWLVIDPDGGTFDGHQVHAHDQTLGTGKPLESEILGIAQWKLRLLKDDDVIVTFDGAKYVHQEIDVHD